MEIPSDEQFAAQPQIARVKNEKERLRLKRNLKCVKEPDDLHTAIHNILESWLERELTTADCRGRGRYCTTTLTTKSNSRPCLLQPYDIPATLIPQATIPGLQQPSRTRIHEPIRSNYSGVKKLNTQGAAVVSNVPGSQG